MKTLIMMNEYQMLKTCQIRYQIGNFRKVTNSEPYDQKIVEQKRLIFWMISDITNMHEI